VPADAEYGDENSKNVSVAVAEREEFATTQLARADPEGASPAVS